MNYDVGRVERKTVIGIAGRRLPALWIMTDMPSTPLPWWTDLIASIPMENGYQAVVIRSEKKPIYWNLFLHDNDPQPETWNGEGDGNDSAECNLGLKTEQAVLDQILEWSTIPTGSLKPKTPEEMYV